jgi:hypothetical protein
VEHELFSNYEDCTLALLDMTFERVRSQIAAAGLDALPWRERVRGGLWPRTSTATRSTASRCA